ncbi:sigma-70 family RNA polymerase sigma factor [Halobacillus sp. Marseille-Q1614]|uniref:sigma-70 family RNA polymerase sigma factor n=1 Tax=Halobacillus sp. Marseille-Q1614 TaxID=2709134 RepID=UPI001570B794|nr:sigma-70 family RNA polymerase sigma factor [Halobacillus sp. Marseille-Q1614]
MTNDELEFENIVKSNERLIYYHIKNLHIKDPNGEYFAEGLEALWKAYHTYNPSIGKFSTYLSWKIRNALIDRIRQDIQRLKKEDLYIQHQKSEDRYLKEDVIEDHYFWKEIQSLLTSNQWKWVYYFIILDKSVEEIALREGVKKDAVKNWGRHARKNLRAKYRKTTTH